MSKTSSMPKLPSETLIETLKLNWKAFVENANELSKRGFDISIESGWEVLDAPIDEEITQIVIEAPKDKN